MRVLGIELESSIRADMAIILRAISPVPHLIYFYGKMYIAQTFGFEFLFLFCFLGFDFFFSGVVLGPACICAASMTSPP